jgi:predicted dinucleotide-binding enzyme
MFICGNDASAKATVSGVCRDFGWEAVDIGGIDGARYLEAAAVIWIRYGALSGTWKHAFKLLR